MEANLDLTTRVMQRLAEEPRNLVGLPTTRAEIEKILAREGCSLNHPIVAFQLEFGGYIYETHYGEKIHLGIWSKPYFDAELNHWMCQFVRFIPNDAQAELVMDEQGAIYWTENPVPLASSIQLYMKSVAMGDWLVEQMNIQYTVGGETKLKIRTINISLLQHRLIQLGLNPVEEATDDYEQWWIDARSTLHLFKVWSSDGSESAVTISADSVERLQELGTAFQGLADFPPESAIWRNPKKIPPQ